MDDNSHLKKLNDKLEEIKNDSTSASQDKIKDFFDEVIKKYKSITNSTFYKIIGGDTAEKDFTRYMEMYCKEEFGVKLPDVLLLKPQDYGIKHKMMTTKPRNQKYNDLASNEEQRNDLLKMILNFEGKDWNRQNIFSYFTIPSAPKGVQQILAFARNEEKSLEDRLDLIRNYCQKKINEFAFSRSSMTNDFYKALASMDCDDKNSVTRVSGILNKLIKKVPSLSDEATKSQNIGQNKFP
jgi:hypothetical protein